LSNSAAIAALLGSAGGAGETYGGGDAGGGSGDPVEALQNCIQDLHGLMQVMPDAKHTQMIHQAMAPLLAIQSEFSKASQGDPRQQLLQQLGQ
jgi:hypothetical protein